MHLNINPLCIRRYKMKFQYISRVVGIAVCSLWTLPVLATNISPTDSEIEQLKRTLASEQAKTQEVTEDAAKKKEVQQLQQEIVEEQQKQQQVTSQSQDVTQTEQPKKLHGVKKRAKKIEKWADKHHF
jgi:hypothetical protein